MLSTASPDRTGTSRPALRIGVFRSARPERHGQAGIGRTFQNIRLFQNMTAEENVLVGCTQAGGRLSRRDVLDADRPVEEVRPGRGRTSCLELVGCTGIGDELAKNLPYGDQRRLEVAARARQRAALLLLDEPTPA
jgi:branched-chain amino acid transport system ATP-binding protein